MHYFALNYSRNTSMFKKKNIFQGSWKVKIDLVTCFYCIYKFWSFN